MTTTNAPQLTAAQVDRAAGVLLGTACGDALGTGYEFDPPLAEGTPVGMVGGGGYGWAPGEWTDDTSMAIAIAETAATGDDLLTAAAQDAIVRRWVHWAEDAKDVGVHTGSLLSSIAHEPTATHAATESRARLERGHKTGGNGSLMRTAPVALAYL